MILRLFWDLCTIDWSAIAAIVSFCMIILTFISLLQSRKQLKEMKRQWDENNRPNICINVIVYNKAYFLQIANIGNVDATNVRLKFNEEFISNIKSQIQPYYNAINDSSFFVESGSSKFPSVTPVRLILPRSISGPAS